ncbi:MAG: hypothetical protein L0H93_09540 [Nocardioides sp.]|nr:hypothetical protein [Nocardioides sp.]
MATLTEKYVHAVTRALPEDEREDVAQELRATIADRVDALLAEDPWLESLAAEHAAVAELDDPARLSAGYTGRPLHLIGPEAYPAYVGLLRALVVTALPIIAVVTVVVGILSGDHFGAIIGHMAWATFNVAVHVFFWTTLVWVLVERNAAPGKVARDLGNPWTPDDLPEPPRATGVPISETVVGLTLLGMAVAFVIGQHFLSWFTTADGDPLPMLDPDLWSGWLLLVVGALLAMMAFEVIRFRAQHWTAPLAVAKTVLTIAFAVPVIWLAVTDRLFNPPYLADLDRLWVDVDAGHLNTIVWITVAVVALWDIADSWRKARLASREEPLGRDGLTSHP